jgi:hypothetical protein
MWPAKREPWFSSGWTTRSRPCRSPSLLAQAKVDTDLDSLRDNARFQAMVAAADARLAAGA